MVKAAKVFLILGMVGSAIGALAMLIMGIITVIAVDPIGGILLIIYTFILLVPFVIDYVGYKKINNATRAKELTTIGILTLIFGGIIPGILILLIKDEDLGDSTYVKKETKPTPDSLEKELKDLNTLKDNGVITEEEYQSARKKIIDKNL